MALTRLRNQSASIITSGTFADARIAASNVSQHATSFDDNKIVNDLATLGLRVHTQNNLNSSNTNSQFVDVFNDANGIDTTTNATRNASEYVSSVSEVAEANTVSVFRPNTTDHSTSTTSISSVVSGDTATLEKVNTGHSGNNLSASFQKFSNTMSIVGTNADDGGWKVVPTSDYNFGTGDWTVEAWTYNNSFSPDGNHRYIVDWRGPTGSRFSIGLRSTSNYHGNTLDANGYQPDGYTMSGWNSGTWTHWAFVKESGTLSYYSNGNRNCSFSDSLSYNFQSGLVGVLAFNQRHGSDSTGWLQGNYTQEIRVSNNARYSGTTYTIPTTQFVTTSSSLNATGNFTSTAISTADSSTISSAGAVITYQDQAGTNALNTDIILQISADNGSNYTTATLTALPDFSSGIKCAKVNDLAIGTPGTQLKYKILFANQSSGVKEARIRGVSLNY